MIAVDTETTGLDIHHGCRPFFVTACDEKGNLTWWEWDVDPLTRRPKVPNKDRREIQKMLSKNVLVFQNPKFDVGALSSIGCRIPSGK